MKEFIKRLDKHLDYIQHEIVGDTIYIYVRSNQKELVCPYCGMPSVRKHSVYKRSFQDLPIMGKKSRWLQDKIVDISLNVSSLTVAELLKDGIADVGKSTICNLLKKRYASAPKGNNHQCIY